MGADRLLIVDGHHYAYRSFYAIRAMNAPDGFPTNALYGFINAIRRMRARVAPTHIAVIWDGGLDDERTEALPEYKAERDPMPDDLELQLDALDEWLEVAGMHSWCHEGVEADDVIGTLTRQAEAAGLPVVIASSDKDFFQLINPNVHLLNPNDKTDTLWQAEQVRAKTGVEPSQIIDWLSLVGDAVDGIPGVRGVGPKTATKLLLEYGTAENLYSNLNAVKPDGLQGRLREATTEVRRNQELVALREIPEWKIKLEELRPGAGDYATLHAKYTRWNFRSLLQELEAGRQGELL
jgi:DNA polymerase-1